MALVYRNPHEHSKELASNELVNLESEEALLEERLKWIRERKQHVRAYLAAIVPLIENDPGRAFADSGLTAMCRDVLTSMGRWVTAQEVKLRLEATGVQFSGYTNAMAVLHSILKRVGQSARNADGDLFYGLPGLNPNNLPSEYVGNLGDTQPPSAFSIGADDKPVTTEPVINQYRVRRPRSIADMLKNVPVKK